MVVISLFLVFIHDDVCWPFNLSIYPHMKVCHFLVAYYEESSIVVEIMIDAQHLLPWNSSPQSSSLIFGESDRITSWGWMFPKTRVCVLEFSEMVGHSL